MGCWVCGSEHHPITPSAQESSLLFHNTLFTSDKCSSSETSDYYGVNGTGGLADGVCQGQPGLLAAAACLPWARQVLRRKPVDLGPRRSPCKATTGDWENHGYTGGWSPRRSLLTLAVTGETIAETRTRI
jgi:hypothetical protein